MNVPVRDLNLEAPPDDGRRLEVIANNLPLWGGAQLAIDTTLVASVRRDGQARPACHSTDGAALIAARRRKERTYPELQGGRGRARLVVLALDVGGRWSTEALEFIRLLARARARSEPELLRKKAQMAWQRRWTAIMAVAAQRAFAESLLELPSPGWGACLDGAAPPVADVLADARYS